MGMTLKKAGKGSSSTAYGDDGEIYNPPEVLKQKEDKAGPGALRISIKKR